MGARRTTRARAVRRIARAALGVAAVAMPAIAACGRSGGGASGTPASTRTPAVLASSAVVGLAATNGYVAWVDTGGAIRVASADGKRAPVTLSTTFPDGAAPSLVVPNAIAAGPGGVLVFATFERGTVFRASLPDGPAQAIAGAGTSADPCATSGVTPCGVVAAVAVGTASLFWAIDDDVWSAPLGGGGATKIVSTGAPTARFDLAALAVVADRVYWAGAVSGTIGSAPAAGGGATALATKQTLDFGTLAFAADAAYVYWTTVDGDAAVVRRVATAGGPTSDVVEVVDPSETPCALASDGTSLYWTTRGYGLKRRAVAGDEAAPVETLVASSASTTLGPCTALALDAANVYFDGIVPGATAQTTGTASASSGAPAPVPIESPVVGVLRVAK